MNAQITNHVGVNVGRLDEAVDCKLWIGLAEAIRRVDIV